MKHSLSFALLSLGIVSSAYAANVELDGTIQTTIPVYQRDSNLKARPIIKQEKQVSFLRFVLSPEAKKQLALNAEKNLTNTASSESSTLPTASFLGMNGVPVLDQGRHGTCVTFATIGAIDATIDSTKVNKSYDRYSQLCSLELGSTLSSESPGIGNKHIYPSGWDGSSGMIVLHQIQTYGLISKAYQESEGCAGVKEYPLNNESYHGRDMREKDYSRHSEAIFPPISYDVIMKNENAFSEKSNPEENLQKVKSALVAKHRVIFGTLLDVSQGSNGAVGSYKTYHDTWILTKAIAANAEAGKINAGHEMIIIGYDDAAEVKGPEGETHKGVLTLRNSWSEAAGDNGNYYMTYDHFKTMAMDAQALKLA